jgi:hypothetical protein
VTFYYSLTGKHPYLSERGAGLSEQFNAKVLREILSTTGQYGAQIGRFISKSLAIDPEHRYESYESLVDDCPDFDLPCSAREWTLERSEILAEAADFFKVKGEPAKSLVMLNGALQDRPNDVILIAAQADIQKGLGIQLHTLGLKRAFEILCLKKGVIDNRFYPKPALDWARSHIDSGRFGDAAAVIQEVIEWKSRIKLGQDQTDFAVSSPFPEYGWYRLYHGDFIRAAEELMAYAAGYSLGKWESVLAVESLWLGGMLAEHADELASRVLEIRTGVLPGPGDQEFWCARALLHRYANKLYSDKLWNIVQIGYMIREGILANHANLPLDKVLTLESIEYEKLFVLAIDQMATGGVHHAAIQSFSQV